MVLEEQALLYTILEIRVWIKSALEISEQYKEQTKDLSCAK